MSSHSRSRHLQDDRVRSNSQTMKTSPPRDRKRREKKRTPSEESEQDSVAYRKLSSPRTNTHHVKRHGDRHRVSPSVDSVRRHGHDERYNYRHKNRRDSSDYEDHHAVSNRVRHVCLPDDRRVHSTTRHSSYRHRYRGHSRRSPSFSRTVRRDNASPQANYHSRRVSPPRRVQSQPEKHRTRSRSSSIKQKNLNSFINSPTKQNRMDTSPIAPPIIRIQRPAKRAWKFDSPPRADGTDGRSDGIGAGTGLVASAASGPLNVNGVPGTISQLLLGDLPQQQSPMGLLAQSLGLSAEQQKAARELYIGNLPPGLDVNQLIEFFNAAMLTLNVTSIPGNPVSRAWIASDGHFAFVEFRTIEEATIGLQLNGLNCMGYALRIGRPKTYPAEYASLLGSTTTSCSNDLSGSSFTCLGGINPITSTGLPSAASAMLAAQAAAAGIGVPKRVIERRPDRLVILDLPPSSIYPELEIKRLLGAFGGLKIFQYFEAPETADSPATGVCVFEYADVTDQKGMEKGLNDRVIAGTKLRVVSAEEAIREGRLSEVMTQAAEAGRNLQEELGGALMKPQIPTRVIMLTNLVTRNDLIDDKEYFDIMDDVHIECSHYGKVDSIEIPRPLACVIGGDESDVGCAFVKFSRLQGAGAARQGLSGRKFAGRTVEAQYFSEKLFKEKMFKNPQPNYETAGRLPDSPNIIETETEVSDHLNTTINGSPSCVESFSREDVSESVVTGCVTTTVLC